VEYALRTIRPSEIDAVLLATAEGFHSDMRDEELELYHGTTEPDRTLVALAGEEIVATSGLISMRMAVPGAVVPTAGVTAVAVLPLHRRRGLLDRMMRAHLEAIHARGEEAIAALWASEAGIYGRWGFGPATRVDELTIRTRDARLLVPVPEARPHAGAPGELLDALRAVHAAVLPERPGMIERGDQRWRGAIRDFEADREGAGRLRALVFDDHGRPGGYALFAVRKRETDRRPDDIVELRELVAATPPASAALWAHLLGLALTRTVHWPGAPDDAELVHMLAEPQAVTTQVGHGLFVRLVDVPRALTQRRYGAPVDLVLDVEDEICPWNAGRWRVVGDAEGARCRATGAEPDLALGATELGAAYLGGTTLTSLAAAGRVEERTPGALAAASHGFGGAVAPWCFEAF
jgi:predicted acetyltransferase